MKDIPIWHLEHGTYYLKEGSDIIHGIKDGVGIGICYSKGDMWTILKHGDPSFVKKYTEDANEKLKKAILEYPDLECFYIEIKPAGDLLELFNHTIQCSGRLKKYLIEEYVETIDMK